MVATGVVLPQVRKQFTMLLSQNSPTGYWTEIQDSKLTLVGVHSINYCRKPCAIHNEPSDHPLVNKPISWCINRGIITRECDHGIVHPDYDGALYYYSINLGNTNIHPCDGCCGL